MQLRLSIPTTNAKKVCGILKLTINLIKKIYFT